MTAGRAVLAQDGLDGLTMQRIAEAVGVRPPSLYKHVPGRAALVQLVAGDVVADVERQFSAASRTGDPVQDLRALAMTLREFALRDPHGFELLFSPLPEAVSPGAPSFAAAAAPVLRACRELVGPEHALSAARTVTAWASGFLRMELAGAFRLGEDVSAAFEYGLALLTDALGSRAAGGGSAQPVSR